MIAAAGPGLDQEAAKLHALLFLLVTIAFVMVLLQRTALRSLKQRIDSLEGRLGHIVEVQIRLRQRVDETQPAVPAAPPEVPEPPPPEIVPITIAWKSSPSAPSSKPKSESRKT